MALAAYEVLEVFFNQEAGQPVSNSTIAALCDHRENQAGTIASMCRNSMR